MTPYLILRITAQATISSLLFIVNVIKLHSPPAPGRHQTPPLDKDSASPALLEQAGPDLPGLAGWGRGGPA